MNPHRTAISAVRAGNAGINVALTLGKQKHMAGVKIALVGVLSSIQYLAWQGLAIQGHTDEESNF